MLQSPCRFYNTTGKCRFGKHCKFAHEVILEQSPILYQDKDGTVNRPQKGATEGEVQTRPLSPGNLEVENGSLNRKQEETRISSSKGKVCRFYFKNGYCAFGSKCRFAHERQSENGGKSSDNDLRKNTNELKDGIDQVQDEGDKKNAADKKVGAAASVKSLDDGQTQNKICHFYKRGYCRYGRRCKLLHAKKERKSHGITQGVEKLSVDESTPAETAEAIIERKKPVLPSNTSYTRDELIMMDGKIEELRNTEIRQLKRRFPKDRFKIVEETNELATFIFTFSPTDPDWPYDVRSFDIQIAFPEDYPLQVFELSLPHDQDLPETVRRYIEVSLEEWREEKQSESDTKGTAENYLRPFLRWLEKNVLGLVTDGLRQLRRELTAKAAGIEFVSSKELKKKIIKTTPDAGNQAEEDTQSGAQPDVVLYKKSDHEPEETYECPGRSEAHSDTDDEEEEEEDEEAETGEEQGHTRPKIALDTERRGTELSFGNMKMWFCTTVMMEKLRLSVRCERCKHQTDLSTPPNQVNSVRCGKCSNDQLLVFRPVLAHTYSSTFGYLDMEGCSVFDVILQDCHMSMGCVKCNRDVLVKKYSPGVQSEIYCRGCHTKMKFACETVKINLLTSAGVDKSNFSGSVHKVTSMLMRRAPNDPAIKEGKALPDNGACKHYKKSFRWLRFPCCGKCFPCDLCHDDKEDHEMKFANRMICGFCCREQPYAAERPCAGCSSALTKVRTSHWEGGHGCRDKIAMSRYDDKKYTNLNKTISNKAQALKDKNKGKKNTKLRHT